MKSNRFIMIRVSHIVLFRRVLFALALFFVLNDSYSNIQIYFQYPFTVNIVFESSTSISKLDLPAVTLCVPNILDEVRFQQQYPTLFDRLERNDSRRSTFWRQSIARRFSIGTILNWTLSFNELFDCRVIFYNEKQSESILCDRLARIEQTISLYKQCFVLFSRPYFNQTYRKWIQNKSDGQDSGNIEQSSEDRQRLGFKVYLQMNRSKLWSGWVDLILSDPPRAYVVYPGRMGFRAVSTNLHKHVQFAYNRVRVRRLPAPYASACFDYVRKIDNEIKDSQMSPLNCESQEHCVQKCHATLSLRRFGRWPSSLQTLPIESVDLNQVHLNDEGDSFQRLRGDCAIKYFRPDCIDTKFEVDIISETMTSSEELVAQSRSKSTGHIKGEKRSGFSNAKRKKGKSHWTQMSLQSNQAQNMQLVYEPMFEIWDLFANVGQAVSLYLGFCVFDFHFMFHFMLKKIKLC